MKQEDILISDFSYLLSQERIALFPSEHRDQSKLLVYRDGEISNTIFSDLPQHIPFGSLLILNNTRVIEARLLFKKETGGVIEVFCLEPFQQRVEDALRQTHTAQWKCLVGGASKWKPGQVLSKAIFINGVAAVLSAVFSQKVEDGYVIKFTWTGSLPFSSILHAAGAIPLPPYLKRKAEVKDENRYQTIFGKQEGSVAAPTAALHFTDAVFSQLETAGVSKAFVTLHVGAGTFKPVKSATIAGHHMHAETFTVTKQVLQKILNAPQVIAVGTTSLRTLESVHWMGVKLLSGQLNNDWVLGQWEAYGLNQVITCKESLSALILWMNDHGRTEINCSTSLLIVPGYTFKIPAGLVTNFHQPQSTLLLLVAAFIGSDWKKIYDHALENDYRFLSYGDSSLLWRK